MSDNQLAAGLVDRQNRHKKYIVFRDNLSSTTLKTEKNTIENILCSLQSLQISDTAMRK